jgi:N6-adenosine-specific RNA methylase IME4
MLKYRLIFVDPPWSFGDALKQSSTPRGASSNYPVLDTNAIAALPVESVCADDAVLCLWCPSALLVEGLRVMDHWGFIHRGVGTWVKQTSGGKTAFGMGHLLRGATEHFLFGTRGSPYKYIVGPKNIRNVWFAENLKHSQKPECVQDDFEKLFGDCAKLELFARRVRPNWTCLGNEIDGLDIREAIGRLAVPSEPQPDQPDQLIGGW